MSGFKSADEYYDAVFERKRQNSPSRIIFRYFFSVATFLLFMIIVLTAYWIWEDYSAEGYRGITWESLAAHAQFRWQEFQQGRIGLD